MKQKIFALGVFTLMLVSSCVTKKKYNELAGSDAQKAGSIEQLTAANDQLKKELAGLQETSAAELQRKQQELNEKEKTLKEREARLEELRSAMNAQRDAVYNLKRQVCDALKCFSPEELNVEMRNGKLYVSLSDKLLFPSGSDALNERGKEAIQMLADVLAGSDMEIMVEGHTDSIPIKTAKYKDNWDLSVHRATTVSRILIEKGIKPERIISSGRGEFQPIADNGTEQGRSLNRRTEIVLAPKLDKLWKLTEEPASGEAATQPKQD